MRAGARVPALLTATCIGSRSHRSPRALVELLWELWLAPLRPGGTWLALKALPLFALWPGLARDARRTRQWLALLLPFYCAEGIVRAMSEAARHRTVAFVAALVALVAFASVLATFRERARLPGPR